MADNAPDDVVKLTDDQIRARRRRNVALGLALAGFMVLIFMLTIVRLGQNITAGAS